LDFQYGDENVDADQLDGESALRGFRHF
jgi:hypothetical protein